MFYKSTPTLSIRCSRAKSVSKTKTNTEPLDFFNTVRLLEENDKIRQSPLSLQTKLKGSETFLNRKSPTLNRKGISVGSIRLGKHCSFFKQLDLVREALDKEEKSNKSPGKRGNRNTRSMSLQRSVNEVQTASPRKTIVLKIMDVDSVPIELLHRLFLSQLVRWVPAEQCINLASRIARTRDTSNETMHRNLHNDVVRLVGAEIGPEVTAVLPRVQYTIAIPFMIDYIRKFGQFSKEFIASAVDKSLESRLFDFVRYASKPKKVPHFITHPHSLLAYVQLMKDSTAKRLLLYHLDPTPLHRQNLLHLGFPVPGLSFHQIKDATVPPAMGGEEKMTELENRENHEIYGSRLGIENVHHPSRELLDEISRQDERQDIGPLLERVRQEHLLHRRSIQKLLLPQDKENKLAELKKITNAACHLQSGKEIIARQDSFSSHAETNIMESKFAEPNSKKDIPIPQQMSWIVPVKASTTKKLSEAASWLQMKKVVETPYQQPTSLPLLSDGEGKKLRLSLKENRKSPTEQMINDIVQTTITNANKHRYRPLFKISKNQPNTHGASKIQLTATESDALTTKDQEETKKWKEDDPIKPWWRRCQLRYFKFNNNAYLLTKMGWRRIEEKFGKNSKPNQHQVLHTPNTKISKEKEERKRKTRARKRRAELCVKASQLSTEKKRKF